MGVELGPAELAQTLKEIQELDTQIRRLGREIEGLSEKHLLGEIAQELKTARGAETEVEGRLEEISHRQHKLDGELDILASKVAKEEEKLFSGTIMNPKELQAIQAEIFSLRKKRDEMETEDLEEMEEIDRLTSEAAAARGRTQEDVSRERAAKADYDSELALLQSDVRALEVKRDSLKALLPAEVRADYDSLLESKGGLAVVPILQGRSCGGCRIDFSRTQIDRFHHGEGIFRCEFCRRILVK